MKAPKKEKRKRWLRALNPSPRQHRRAQGLKLVVYQSPAKASTAGGLIEGAMDEKEKLKVTGINFTWSSGGPHPLNSNCFYTLVHNVDHFVAPPFFCVNQTKGIVDGWCKGAGNKAITA